MESINAKIVYVTPDMASTWLARNLNNRPVSEAHVQVLTGRMRRNEWKLNGEAIKFTPDGYLLDGQHRLHAISRSGVTVPLLVVEGVYRETFDTMDQGKSRSAADVLAVKGEANASHLATACRLAMLIMDNPAAPNFSQSFSPIQIEKFIKVYPEIRSGLKVAQFLRKISEPGTVIAMHFLFWQKDREKAALFFQRLYDGAGLSVGHPILTLRDRLISNKASQAKLSRQVLVAYYIKAWNAFRLGKDMKITRLASDEAFPIVL